MKRQGRSLVKGGRAPKKIASSHNGARDGVLRRAVFRDPKNDLETVTRRYIELYDFAPTPYVSLDRTGRIMEVNFAASKLLGLFREKLVGRPFALHVAKADSQSFFDHIFRCRTQVKKIQTELNLTNNKGV